MMYNPHFFTTVLTGGLLYLGPETIMPLASILAALIGFALIAWRYIVNFFKKAFKFVQVRIFHKTPEEPVYVEAQEDSQ
jgi:hypothetical protein